MENDESNIYIFLAKKTKQLSRETQEWMEDEVMRIYMEARQKDRAQERRQEMAPYPAHIGYNRYALPATTRLDAYYTANNEYGLQYEHGNAI
ncbi:hypothetical protein RRG08_047072 [Elysia crispata]|uniref:Uncharacterized protein n=1 Tax=Elysia crispata TaxID=231223 RepID=A0AAE1AW94_9GAST|nr:hypothetical protein RRG08_047072 [Elysia crispata]